MRGAHLDLGLLDGLDQVVVKAEPLLVGAHECDVVAVVGPAARMHDDRDELVFAALLDGVVAQAVGEAEVDREGDPARPAPTGDGQRRARHAERPSVSHTGTTGRPRSLARTGS